MPKPANAVRRSWKSLFLLPSAVFVGAVAVQSQQPVFRSGTTLIEFTFVALDGKGNPVTDLKKDEVALTERGHPRDIAFFRFDGNAPAVAEPAPPLAPGYATNRPVPERNASAFLFDLINTHPNDQTCAR